MEAQLRTQETLGVHLQLSNRQGAVMVGVELRLCRPLNPLLEVGKVKPSNRFRALLQMEVGDKCN